MRHDFMQMVQDHLQNREVFAIAQVVNRTHPTSGKPGDKAVITASGQIKGWIGGGCTRGIVIKEALLAMKENKPRVVSIQPEATQNTKPGVVEYKMTCQSGGMVELYIEPILPKPHLLILGKSHVAMALSRIGKAMNYQVSVLAPNADKAAFPDADLLFDGGFEPQYLQPNSFIVVCTQGERDEEALEFALNSNVNYISFVASRRKAQAIFTNLRDRGITFDQLSQIKTPAGLDINAKLPEEVAISILAEIIQHLRSNDFDTKTAHQLTNTAPSPTQENQSSTETGLYINPVCGIPVEKATAKHILQYQDQKVYFCCDGCKTSFEKEPEKYVSAD